jgi:hypothetical protein
MSEIESIVQNIKSELHHDLVSSGWLMQEVREANGTTDCMEQVIRRLLSDGVEIGYAIADGEYVKFIAWNGTIDERYRRAHHERQLSEGHDRSYAFWLCLHANVDEYEKDFLSGHL